MSLILVRGRRIVTMNAERTVISDGAVLVDGATIAEVGPYERLRANHPDATDVGLAEVVTPGFINAHQHLTGDRLMHSRIPDRIDSQQAIFDWSVPLHAEHTEQDDYLSATLALAESLSNGVTTTVEAGTVAHPAAVLRAQKEIGTRGTLGSWGWDVPSGPWAGSVAEVLDRQREIMSLAPRGGLVEGWVTLVGHHLMSDELVVAASNLARERGTRITFHLSPHAGDAIEYLERTKRRPAVHLNEIGALGSHVLVAHGVHLDDKEVDAIVTSGTALAACPWAYLRLGQGVTWANRYLDVLARGGHVALGCDTENAGDAIDVLRAASLFAGILRDGAGDPACFTAEHALALATIDGARAIGMEDRIGSIETGKQADLVAFSGTGYEWLPLGADPYLQLVWGTDGRSVRDVWVAGRQVVADGEVVTVDVAAAAEEARARAERLAEKIRTVC
jgi:5-methylthioadenosine/S-adenosylhomocysteine deaminase